MTVELKSNLYDGHVNIFPIFYTAIKFCTSEQYYWGNILGPFKMRDDKVAQ